jgi:hypothetical protein
MRYLIQAAGSFLPLYLIKRKTASIFIYSDSGIIISTPAFLNML